MSLLLAAQGAPVVVVSPWRNLLGVGICLTLALFM